MFELRVFTPWAVASMLFRPDDERSHPVIQWISICRCFAGMAAIIYFSLANGVWPADEVAVMRTAVIAAFVVVAWVIILLLCTSHPVPKSVKQGSLTVLKRVASFFASIAIILVIIHIPVVAIFALLWIIPFLWCSFWFMCRHFFGAGDAHPMLAPLVTASTSALLSVYNLSTIHTSKIPPRLDVMIVLSGLGTTLLLSLVEFFVLLHDGERFTKEPTWARANDSPVISQWTRRR